MGHPSTKLPPNQLRDLASATNLTTTNVQMWYSRFLKDYPTGKITREQLVHLYRCYYKAGDAAKFADHVFRVFDTDNNGQVDFREFICSLAVLTNGSVSQKLRWAFKIYDVDGNGEISEQELLAIIRSIRSMAGCVRDVNVSDKKVMALFKSYDVNDDGVLTMEEFVQGSRGNPVFMKMLQDYVK